MKPAHKFILLFVMVLFVVLTLLRLVETNKPSEDKPDQSTSTTTTTAVPAKKSQNTSNPFGSEDIVVNTQETAPKLIAEEKESAKCELDDEDYQNIQFEFDKQLTDQDRDELLLLTGLDSLSRRTQGSTDEEKEKAKKDTKQRLKKRLSLLRDSYRANKNPLVALKILGVCLTNYGGMDCQDNELEEIYSDHAENGFVWLFAVTHYEKTDASKIAMAIENMLNANTFSMHRDQYISEIYNFMTNHGATPIDALINTIGFEAARWFPLSSLSRYCDTNKQPEICLAVGEHLENNGRIMVNEAVGMSLQQRYWQERGNVDAVEQLEQKRKNLYEIHSEDNFTQLPRSDEAAEIYLKSLNIEREKDRHAFLAKAYRKYLQENPDVCAL